MKKKIFVILSLALACLLVLSGCACQHEWKEADCLNAKVCTKCEEVEGEPLGHDWQEATCAAPETCSRCGETQGEMLEHTYGKWVIGESDMTRTCEGCGNKESAEIDREVALMQILEGHWDFYSQTEGDTTTYAHQMKTDYQYLNLHFDLENGSWFNDGETTSEIVPEFVEYLESNGLSVYLFNITFYEDGSQAVLFYMDSEDQVGMTANNITYAFTKNQELADVLTGTWGSVDAESVNTLDLKEDRTFTASIDGEEYAGTWHLRAPSYYRTSRDENAPIYAQAGLDLMYEKDGKVQVKTQYLSLGEKDKPLEEVFRYNGFTLKLGKDFIYLDRINAEDLEELIQANANGAQEILGKWESSKISVYTYSTSSSNEVENTNYSITFAEDGTFTATLDQERAGTWKFQEADISGNIISYSYKLKFDGVSQDVYANIGYNNELHFGKSDNNSSTSIYFNQMTEAEKAELAKKKEESGKLILGEWTSTAVTTYENNIVNEVSDTSKIFTFNADGTFTTTLEAVPAGTWTVGDVDIQTYENGHTSTNYSYNLKAEGIEGNIHASIFGDGNSGYDLSFSVYSNNTSTSYHCLQLSAEDLEKMANADDMIIGTWSGEEFTQYNEAAQKMEVVRKESHTLTVNADGTFTSTLPDMAEGTWSFWKVDQHGVGFSFHYGESGIIYRIDDAGYLNAFIQEGDNAYFMDMTKQ